MPVTGRTYEPCNPAGLALIKEQDIRPDLKSKGDTLCFTRVELPLKQEHQSLIGGFDHTQPPRLAGIPDLICPRTATALFYDFLPDRRRNTDG